VVCRVASRVLAARPEPRSHGTAWLWQVLPLQDLAQRPFESLWFLHSQPPLYNAIVALCLQLPGSAATWLHVIWIAVGYGMVAVMFKWFRLAAIPRTISHVAVLAFAMNPSLILYENFLFYTYLEAFCILAAMYGLAQGAGPAGPLFSVHEVLVGFRAIFQPLWAVAMAGAAWLTMRPPRTASATVALLGARLLRCRLADQVRVDVRGLEHRHVVWLQRREAAVRRAERKDPRPVCPRHRISHLCSRDLSTN
jgi:hypothetical protein